MRLPLTALLAASLVSPAAAEQKSIGSIKRLDDRIDALLPADATLDVLAEGFEWTEGPVWMPTDAGGELLFSEIPSNSIRRWSPPGQTATKASKDGPATTIWMQPSGYTGVADYGGEPGSNGLMLDAKGRLLLCEHGDRRVAMLTPDGGKMTLADRYDGKRLNSPNDLVVHSSGAIFFTDPPYGLPGKMGDPRQELDFCGVYRLDPDRTVHLLTKEFDRPNGIGLSPDQSTLYVAQSDPESPIIKAFALSPAGEISGGRVFHGFTGTPGKGLPDGLAVASGGELFATGPGGVWVFATDGTPLAQLATGQATSNCAFGGPDGTDLFITADMYVLRVRTKTTGIATAQ